MIEIINSLLNNSTSLLSKDQQIEAGIKWLSKAQDTTTDGGVAIRFSLLKKWGSSYPETTGYIIPTFLKYFESTQNVEYRDRAIKMAEWELSIQQEDGSFVGGSYQEPVGKLIFDTGQIIFGLIWAYKYSNDEKFLVAAVKAGNWLVKIQDNAGYWSQNSFQSIPHVYHSRVAWALAQLYKITENNRYLNSVLSHTKWVLSNQETNGWFQQAGFTTKGHEAPYTHTIAYTIRGILEIGIILHDQNVIDAAILSAKNLLKTIENGGFFWGKYNANWKSNENFTCLTGNAQISIIFSRIYQQTGDIDYISAVKSLNNYLSIKQSTNNKKSKIYGAIPGSWPIWGEYERFSYPNWATKFFVDALILEKNLQERETKQSNTLRGKNDN